MRKLLLALHNLLRYRKWLRRLSYNAFMKGVWSNNTALQTEQSSGAVSGLAYLEAPESLDEAVQLAKVAGIIEQIEATAPGTHAFMREWIDKQSSLARGEITESEYWEYRQERLRLLIFAGVITPISSL